MDVNAGMLVGAARRCVSSKLGRDGVLARGPAAVDQDGVAGDEGGGRRGQENDGAGDVHGFADAVEGGDALDDVGAKGGVGEGFVSAGSSDEGGGDGVHGDSVLAPFNRQTFC